MNDSFASADDKETNPKNLFQQINVMAINDWNNDDFEFSPYVGNHISQENEGDAPYDYNLPLQSKINEPSFEEPELVMITPKDQKIIVNKQDMKPQQGVAPSLFSSQGKVPSQLTITLNEASILSQAYDQIDTEDSSSYSTSLKSFLNLNERNYRPHLTCMKTVYNKCKEHSKKSLNTLKVYGSFLEIKMKQQIESLKLFDEQEASQTSENIEEFNEDLYLDQKALVISLRSHNRSQKEKRKYFYDAIKEIYEKLMSIWRKIKQKREKKERIIDEDIIRIIDRIEMQMEDIIKCRLQNERQKVQNMFMPQKIRSQNPYLMKDKYLEIKYLMQRQSTYLELINNFNGKLVTYLVNMFSKEQITICKMIEQSIADYAWAYMECYDSENKVVNKQLDLLDKLDFEGEVKKELCQKLLCYIPKQICNIQSKILQISNPKDRLEAILSEFNNQIQNIIFITTIQMNNEYILFRNEAIWKTTTTFIEKQQNSIDYESRQALANDQSKEIGNKKNQAKTQQKQNIKVVAVLTSNYYLHLENEDKIATLRLGDIKLSKKGRQVIIVDKGKGFSSYFSPQKQLGRLEFDSIEEVDIFSQKLSLALRKIG